MNGALRNPSEFELHAFVDGRLDPLRASEIETLLTAAGDRDRVDGWLRGRDALRLVYDPVAHEPPPQFLADVVRRAPLPPPQTHGRAARPARPAPARRPRETRAAVIWLAVATGFCAGAAATLIGSALLARLTDPQAVDLSAALSRALALVLRGLGFEAP